MPGETTQQAARDIAFVLPERANDLRRLAKLAGNDVPTVTVIGKYNHGKSRLLNELIGSDVFAVADKRETVRLSERRQHGVRWLDAPGLDADVGTQDDRHAFEAAWLDSDIRLFVHAAKEGELDAAERNLLADLLDDGTRTLRQTLFVLTLVDQMADDTESQAVTNAIRKQIPGIGLFAVSSTRHRKGIVEGKMLLLEKSGIPALHLALKQSLAEVPGARLQERCLLTGEIKDALSKRQIAQESHLDVLRDRQRQQREAFDEGLKNVIDKVSADVMAMLAGHRGDDALIPDSASDTYALTAGKRERNRLQIGYSRACIEIDSFLIGHGVIELPTAQQTASSSINSVMIAVMGISVKLHKELSRIFGAASGRERMQRAFTHYYELSAARRKLVAQIDESRQSLAATAKARIALMAFDESECV